MKKPRSTSQMLKVRPTNVGQEGGGALVSNQNSFRSRPLLPSSWTWCPCLLVGRVIILVPIICLKARWRLYL